MAAPLMYVLYGQEAQEVEPGRLEYVLNSQELHALLPVIFEYVPAGHSEHDDDLEDE